MQMVAHNAQDIHLHSIFHFVQLFSFGTAFSAGNHHVKLGSEYVSIWMQSHRPGESALIDGGKASVTGTGAKVTVGGGSCRAKVTVRGCCRGKVTVRGSCRGKVTVRGSGRAKVTVLSVGVAEPR